MTEEAKLEVEVQMEWIVKSELEADVMKSEMEVDASDERDKGMNPGPDLKTSDLRGKDSVESLRRLPLMWT